MKTYVLDHRIVCAVVSVIFPISLFLYAKEINPNTGGAAFTSTLKDFGFDISMNVGLVILISLGITTYICYEQFLIRHYRTKLEKEIKNNKINTIAKVHKRIDQYNISKSLKRLLKSNYL